ncbi:AraC family transcriptional regulator [Bacterioplanoides pacificum]|uniref:AraC family transcriptional regulator n=1 Tax=Bacterioplanoides pacificum TaxID=1171596 RepID=A0ABV7VVW8_9GAMM
MNNQTIKTVSSLWLRALLMGAEHQGIDVATLLAAAGLDKETLEQPYARVSLEKTLKIWRTAEALCQSPDFGLLMGEQVKPSHFQLFSVSLMHSETLAGAFEKSIRYTRLVSDGGDYFLQQQGAEAALVYRPAGDNFSRHQIDAVLVLLRSFANWLVCKTLPLIRLEVTHCEPQDLSNYQRIFNAPVIFSAPRNALVFAPQVLTEPLALSDNNLAAMHEQMLEQQLAQLLQPDTANLVEHMLRCAVELHLDREQVAQQLHMSSRTLQRKLRDRGTSFQILLEQERQRRAKTLLASTDQALSVISDQLGFAESSAFSRAFKRWSGLSPLEYRRQLNHGND